MSIITSILEKMASRVEARKSALPLDELKSMARDREAVRSLRGVLSSSPFSVIAEYKRKSPSRGDMVANTLNNVLAVYNSTDWISAVSVLTDVDYFGGSVSDLQDARKATGKPILRKDFIKSEYQVFEARAFGADAILLMAGLFVKSPAHLSDLHQLARSLGLDVLVELGMVESEMEDLKLIVPKDAEILGINSRQFRSRYRRSKILSSLFDKDLTIDKSFYEKYRHLADGKIAIAESGVSTRRDLSEIKRLDYKAALIGTAFLKKDGRLENAMKEFDTVFHPQTTRSGTQKIGDFPQTIPQ